MSFKSQPPFGSWDPLSNGSNGMRKATEVLKGLKEDLEKTKGIVSLNDHQFVDMISAAASNVGYKLACNASSFAQELKQDRDKAIACVAGLVALNVIITRQQANRLFDALGTDLLGDAEANDIFQRKPSRTKRHESMAKNEVNTDRTEEEKAAIASQILNEWRDQLKQKWGTGLSDHQFAEAISKAASRMRYPFEYSTSAVTKQLKGQRGLSRSAAVSYVAAFVALEVITTPQQANKLLEAFQYWHLYEIEQLRIFGKLYVKRVEFNNKKLGVARTILKGLVFRLRDKQDAVEMSIVHRRYALDEPLERSGSIELIYSIPVLQMHSFINRFFLTAQEKEIKVLAWGLEGDVSGFDLSYALSVQLIDTQTGPTVEIPPMSLSTANLRGTGLAELQLSGADLHGADLRSVGLTHANLQSASLRMASLASADLSGAHLGNADLSGADLTDADLRGADLSSAKLEGTILRGVKVDETTKTTLGRDMSS